jgi:hypothetical protein
MALAGIRDQTPELQTLIVHDWAWAWKCKTDQYKKHTHVFDVETSKSTQSFLHGQMSIASLLGTSNLLPPGPGNLDGPMLHP